MDISYRRRLPASVLERAFARLVPSRRPLAEPVTQLNLVPDTDVAISQA